MKVHLIEIAPNRSFCNVKSLLAQYTNDPKETDCKVCKELWEIQTGKRDTMSFGGDLDKRGRERRNKGRRWGLKETYE